MLLLPLLLSISIGSAQEPDIPPIVYKVDNQLWYFEGGESTLITENLEYASHFAWSPDGSWLAYMTAPEDPTAEPVIHLTDLAGTTFDLVTPSMDSATAFSWTADGRILYASFVSQDSNTYNSLFEVYAIAPQADAHPARLGTFEIGELYGGGSPSPGEQAYSDDTLLDGWYKPLFVLTDFGIVHDGLTVYPETGPRYSVFALTLTNFATGNTAPLADGALWQGIISPDGTKVAGIEGEQLVVVNLQDLTSASLETIAFPDQFIWHGNDAMIYTTREITGDILADLTEEERNQVASEAGSTLERYAVGIHRIGLDGSGSTLYTADAYAIGRLYTSRGTLIFSQIENQERWVERLLDGSLAEWNAEVFNDSVHTQVYALALETLNPVLILEDAARMTPRPQ